MVPFFSSRVSLNYFAGFCPGPFFFAVSHSSPGIFHLPTPSPLLRQVSHLCPNGKGLSITEEHLYLDDSHLFF